MGKHLRTRRTATATVDEQEQELTRRLSVYEEQDRTQRFEVPVLSPWDALSSGGEPDERASGQPQRRRHGSAAALIALFLLVGLVIGVWGTLAATSAERSRVPVLESQLAEARRAIADGGQRISALEQEIQQLQQQLEEAQARAAAVREESRPRVALPDVPRVRIAPSRAQGGEFLGGIPDQIRSLVQSFGLG
jgi:hypothetical protein